MCLLGPGSYNPQARRLACGLRAGQRLRTLKPWEKLNNWVAADAKPDL
jgi:hypothetical protein